MSERIIGAIEDRVVGVLGEYCSKESFFGKNSLLSFISNLVLNNKRLGGGQYGRLLAEAGSRLAIPIVFLDPSPESPAKQISAISLLRPDLAHQKGDYTNEKDIQALAETVDVITVEIEHVDVQALHRIRDQYRSVGKGVEIFPSPETITIVQDKLSQKKFLHKLKIPVSEFVDLSDVSPESVGEATKALGFPFLLKARRNAYDGRGNYLVKSPSDISLGLQVLKGPLYAERYIEDIVNEIVVVLVRNLKGEIRSYGTSENVKNGKVGHLVRAPARLHKGVILHAQSLAETAISYLDEGAVGVFGVEFFVLADGESTVVLCCNKQI